jgi:hypothetical protein
VIGHPGARVAWIAYAVVVGVLLRPVRRGRAVVVGVGNAVEVEVLVAGCGVVVGRIAVGAVAGSVRTRIRGGVVAAVAPVSTGPGVGRVDDPAETGVADCSAPALEARSTRATLVVGR